MLQSDLPTVVALSPKKLRYMRMSGAREVRDIKEWLDRILRGAVPAASIQVTVPAHTACTALLQCHST